MTTTSSGADPLVRGRPPGRPPDRLENPSPPLRILHVIPSISPARGGPSFVVRTLAEGQAELGMQVHVAATDDDGPGRRAPRIPVPFTESNVTYWIFPRQTRFYSFSLPLTAWLRKHVAGYDVVHIHALFSYSSVAAAWLAARAGVPYIVRPLGTLSPWSLRNRRRWLKGWSYRLIESRILKYAAAVHYTSEQEAEDARRLGCPDRGIVVPNPVDGPAFRAVPRIDDAARPPVLLLLSRLDPKKGLDLLLPAFARVRLKLPGATLLIAGDGDASYVDSLKRRSRELGLETAVVWTGFLQGEAKRAALEQAHVFVLPSYSENFGVAVVEALGAGLPVVVSNQVGIHREISAARAGLVTECTVASLEAALLQMLRDSQMRARMAQRAVELARTFSSQAVTQQLAAVYARINRRRQSIAA